MISTLYIFLSITLYIHSIDASIDMIVKETKVHEQCKKNTE